MSTLQEMTRPARREGLDEIQAKDQELRRDGFVFFRQLFESALARQAYDELTHWYEIDDADREKKKITQPLHCGPAGKTIKTPPSHLMIDAYGKSPALDRIMDIILTHPLSATILGKLAGEHRKFRGYNIRLMTGNYDPGPCPKLPPELTLPHDWHRDSPGEFGIGIFLSDVPKGGNGGTALMRGSHLFPYCPRWNTLLSSFWTARVTPPVSGSAWFSRFNIFNRLLGKKLRKRATEASGAPGDCYFFLNDVWHGRYQNLHGKKTMIVLVGGFPTEFPFPDEVEAQPREVLDRLPESIRKGLTAQPANPDKSSFIYWMLANRPRAIPFGLFFMARLERVAANVLTVVLRAIQRPFRLAIHYVHRAIAIVRRRLGSHASAMNEREPAQLKR